MTRSVVIFEDHSLNNFRPLALSVPTYEIRMGIFNLRERLELVLKDMGEGSPGGTLLCRQILSPLHTCENWSVNPETMAVKDETTERFFWINGRCAPDFSDLLELLAGGVHEDGFFCFDDHGLIAADLSSKESLELYNSWMVWNTETAGSNPTNLEWDYAKHLKNTPEVNPAVSALGYIWDIVPATADLLAQDVNFLSDGKPFSRRPFGVFPTTENSNAYWLENSSLTQACKTPELASRFAENGQDIWFGQDVNLAEGVVLDAAKGPIVLDRNVTIMPHCYLEGPLYIGPGSTVKAGAAIYGESSFGIGNRLSGEIGESTFADFANKQHDGFIGHAVLGSWTNLGAMTTCSDLKNNYGDVRVDLGFGAINTGLRFVGLLMGDHTKTAIGTLFNTGTCVGFASNIFGGVMPPKFVCSFSWGGLADSPFYDVEKAIETSVIVMSRRGCSLSEEGKALIRHLA